jgi:hypothetical protein
MPNVENIRLLREHMDAYPPELFIMGHVTQETDCGTAMCFAGFFEALWGTTAGSEMRSSAIARKLSITPTAAVELMLPDHKLNYERFDESEPAKRKAVMLHVLDTLHETGWPKWREALEIIYDENELRYINGG